MVTGATNMLSVPTGRGRPRRAVLGDAVVVDEDGRRADVRILCRSPRRPRRTGAAPSSRCRSRRSSSRRRSRSCRARRARCPAARRRRGRRRAGADARTTPVRPDDVSAGPHLAVEQGGVGADGGTRRDRGPPVQLRAGQQGDVGRELDGHVTHVLAGSTTVTPARIHPVERPAVEPAPSGQLHPVVDARDLPGVRGRDGDDRRPSAARSPGRRSGTSRPGRCRCRSGRARRRARRRRTRRCRG